MSWQKMYKQHLPKLYHCLVRNYQLNNIKLNYIYPRPEQLVTKEDYHHYTNLYLDALTYPEFHHMYKQKQIRIHKKNTPENKQEK